MTWRFLLFLLLAVAARGEVTRVKIGGVTLRVPAPEGFVRSLVDVPEPAAEVDGVKPRMDANEIRDARCSRTHESFQRVDDAY